MTSKSARATFKQPTADLGVGIDVRNVAEALEQLEGPGRPGHR